MKSVQNLIKSFSSKKKSYSLNDIERGHQNITYRGVPCIKCPFDYVIYQMIINEVKPDLILEIGTNHGGSALYLADLLNIIGNGEIHSIDIDDRSFALAKAHSRIKLFHDGWENYDTSLLDKYDKILIIEDASHEYKNTLMALQHFGKYVSLNSFLIVEDGIIDALGWTDKYNGGPVKAIEEFLHTNKNFEIDYKWINMFGEDATFNTKGYLKKVKL